MLLVGQNAKRLHWLRCSDLESGAKYEAKTAHYAPLGEELMTAGWNVHHTTHVLTMGVRVTVPLRNLEVLEGLQMSPRRTERSYRAA
eukprot:21682-Pyramimonas_sp.AAC.1